MKIDLNDPTALTLENVKELIASGTDETHSQIRVSKDGIAYLSKVVGNQDIDDVAFMLEIFCAGNDYVGPRASEDDKWVGRIYECLKSNWPNPSSRFIDQY